MKIRILLLFIFSLVFSSNTKAQELDTEKVKRLIESKMFEFIPQSVSPQAGPNRLLTNDFSLRVEKDSIDSNLPYFGRAYTIQPGDKGGMIFQSGDFKYQVKEKKKGWDVSIRPGDTREIRLMNFMIYRDGTASLFVNSNNRQSIRYYGKIRELNQRANH